MGYAARAGFGAGFWQTVQTQAAKTVAAKTAPAPAPVASAPSVTTPPLLIQPPILVAGPAPSPSGGGGGGGGEAGLAPATGGLGALLQQPAVLVGIAILGFLALRRGGGTRRF